MMEDVEIDCKGGMGGGMHTGKTKENRRQSKHKPNRETTDEQKQQM